MKADFGFGELQMSPPKFNFFNLKYTFLSDLTYVLPPLEKGKGARGGGGDNAFPLGDC